MYPQTVNIAPTMLTAEVVSIPANTSVMPKARTIGHAVGEGISMPSKASCCVFIGTSTLIFPLLDSSPDDVNNGEDYHPHRVHKMPVQRQDIETICVLLLHLPPKCEYQNNGEKDKTHCHVEAMQADQ